MSPILIFSVIAGYFAVLMIVSWLTARKSNTLTFFNANKSSPWYLVAYGMIGASLSGVTFISVPGEVGNTAFSYLQFVLGNLVGYWLIAFLLLPFYYRLKLISIYSFLEKKMGFYSLKTASFFFLISKVIGAAFRLYLVALVLQLAFFDAFGIPFSISVCISVLLIWLYTYRAGIKTIVWTDTLQTTFLVLAVVFTIYQITKLTGIHSGNLIQTIRDSGKSQFLFFDWRSPNFFFKQFLSGIFMTIVINGMDQDIMQKNLTCKNLKEARKNMLIFSTLFFFIVILFLGLGVMLYHYAELSGIAIPDDTDQLYPLLALNYLGKAVAVAFLLGITAAAFSSADSALTAMTTSFCVDFLGMGKNDNGKTNLRKRNFIHFGFALLLMVVILVFKMINDDSVVNAVFTAASYTYGPILGLFIFSFFFKTKVKDKYVPLIAISAPLISYLLDTNSQELFNGYQFGYELLMMNGLLTILGLYLIKTKN